MAGDRVLIVLDDTFDAPSVDLPQWARTAVQNAADVHVIAPYIGSRLSVLGDDDEPRRQAARRLDLATEHMESLGVHPPGSVSDDSPFEAITTHLLDHEVERIVVAVTADGHWREKGLMEKLRSTTDALVQGLPVINS